MNTNLRRRGTGRAKLAVGALALTAAVTLTPATADAHFFGGKYYKPASSWLYMPWTHSGAYYTPVKNAMSSWYNTPTTVYPYYSTDYNTSRADFWGYSYEATWWGYSANHYCYSGCYYTWADEYLNTKTLASDSDFTRQKVAAHEFGHGIGLAHADTATTSIMRQGYLSYNTPQTHDNNDTNSLYPW